MVPMAQRRVQTSKECIWRIGSMKKLAGIQSSDAGQFLNYCRTAPHFIHADNLLDEHQFIITRKAIRKMT